MNVVQTYYSISDSEDVALDKAGFLTADMNWMSMALSCILLKKRYGHVSLYCNERAKDFITKEIGIPFDDVIVMPDILDAYKGCELWALPKVYTYSQQREPFLHIDSDWYMFDKLNESIINSDVIGQNIEYDDQFCNRKTLERLIEANAKLPRCITEEYEKEPVLRVINAGVIGGNNITFLNEYVKMVLGFVTSNRQILKELNNGFINSIYEQLFLYVMAKERKLKAGYCTEGYNLSTRFDWLPVDFTFSPKSGYMHLLAGLKRRFDAYTFVCFYLYRTAPELQKRIVQVCASHGIYPKVTLPCMLDMCCNDCNVPIDRNLYGLLIRNWDILWNTPYLCRNNLRISINSNGKYSYIAPADHKTITKGQMAGTPMDNTIIAELPDAVLGRTIKIAFTGIKSGMFRYVEESYCEQNEYLWADELIRSMITSNIFVFYN